MNERVPYTAEGMSKFIANLYPSDNGEVESWVGKRFEHMKQLGLRMKHSVAYETARQWAMIYGREIHGSNNPKIGGNGHRILRHNLSIQ